MMWTDKNDSRCELSDRATNIIGKIRECQRIILEGYGMLKDGMMTNSTVGDLAYDDDALRPHLTTHCGAAAVFLVVVT